MTPLAAADYLSGLAAYEQGDYEAALRIWRPLADSGDAEAQHRLGEMYLLGRGMARNEAEAARWFELSAAQGNRLAQYELGMMYLDGLYLDQSDVRAVKWLTLSKAKGHSLAEVFLEMLQNTISADDFERGRQMADDWSEAH